MYSCSEQDHAAARFGFGTAGCYQQQPCVTGRSVQSPSAHHQPDQAVHAAVAGSAAAVQAQQPRRAKKKHAARPSSRRSSTTVVATDVANFRAMVQELTGFPLPASAIFRPLPRRVHAASPFVAAAGQGYGGGAQYGPAGWEAANSVAGGNSSPDAPSTVQPVMAQPPQCLPPGVFDGLPDLGSPEFDSWADLSTEQALVGRLDLVG